MAPVVARARSRPGATALVLVLVLAYSWVAGHFSTFTRPAEVATFIPGAIGVAVAIRARRPSTVRPDRSRSGWLAWWLTVVAVTVVEVLALVLGANHDHPTISDLVNPWLDPTPARALWFALWLGFGYWLSRR